MLLVPRCFDADIVHSSVRERGGVIKLSEACPCLPVAKENTECAPSMRENKGKDVKPDEGKDARDLAQLCCEVAVNAASVSVLASRGNLSGCQLWRK